MRLRQRASDAALGRLDDEDGGSSCACDFFAALESSAVSDGWGSWLQPVDLLSSEKVGCGLDGIRSAICESGASTNSSPCASSSDSSSI